MEGHTDNIQGNGRGAIKDNWDLSVMRAYIGCKNLIRKSIYESSSANRRRQRRNNPIATNETPEGRKMNRRIEMILSLNWMIYMIY